MIISKIRNFEKIDEELVSREELRKRMDEGYVLSLEEEAMLEDAYFSKRYIPAESKLNREVSKIENSRAARDDQAPYSGWASEPSPYKRKVQKYREGR